MLVVRKFRRRLACRFQTCSCVNRCTNSCVGSASTEVSCHCGVNFFSTGPGRSFKQGCSANNLAGLTITTLCNLIVHPATLQINSTGIVRDQTLYSCNFRCCFFGDTTHVSQAGSHGVAIDQHSASTATSYSTTVLGASEAQFVTKYPQ